MVENPGGESRTASPQPLFEEAVALHKRGDHKGAIERYRHLLSQGPDHPQVLNMCATATVELGDLPEAAELLERAVKADPAFRDGWVNLGLVQQKLGNHEAAAKAYDQFRTLNPASPVGHLNFANACQLQKRFDDAVTAYEQALSLAPNDPAIWSNLANAHIQLGNWKKASEATDRTLTLAPGHTGAIAMKSIALQELGKSEEWCNLVDFDRLIDPQMIDPPKGFSDLDSFNQALCEHCLKHPSLVYEPKNKSTTKGYQTSNMAHDENKGPVGLLLNLIDDAVRRYQETHPIDPEHPFLAQRPSNWKHDIWCTILGTQGHQASHIHRSAWLSGCYYAKMPNLVTSDSTQQAGWIEFGRNQTTPVTRAEPIVRAYKPEEGMIVLFPSYFYHRTEPFESEDKRISIAFDIVPLA